MIDWGADLAALLPELVLSALVLVVIVADLWLPARRKPALTGLTVGGLVLTAAACLATWGVNRLVFAGYYVVDDFSVVVKLITVAIGVLTALFGPSYLRVRRLPLGEFNAILLFGLLGMFVLASSSDLVTLFLGLELMVMPSYLLTGFAKTDRYSNEGGLKYFLLGSFGSAILLFGIAWAYGFAGTTRFDEIAATLGGDDVPIGMFVAIGFLTVGATFKIAAVPFHYWTPDAYQGAPTPITGFLSVGPKLGAFALLIRLFVEALGPLRADWLGVMLALTVLTMTGGNIVALAQTNVKRMLAYSSIAHTGYILVGLAAFGGAALGSAAEQAGLEALLFYSAAYAFMNLGAFACVAALQRRPGVTSQIATFGGLGRRAPLLGVLMFLFLLSLTGIPPLAGFWAKWYVIQAALQVGGWLNVLAVVTVLNAAVAAFYYLRVVVYMYMRDAPDGVRPVSVGGYTRVGLTIAALLTIFIGLVPPITGAVIDMAREAARALL
jgi:NADH-quinone oxidoreductase subunit N